MSKDYTKPSYSLFHGVVAVMDDHGKITFKPTAKVGK